MWSLLKNESPSAVLPAANRASGARISLLPTPMSGAEVQVVSPLPSSPPSLPLPLALSLSLSLQSNGAAEQWFVVLRVKSRPSFPRRQACRMRDTLRHQLLTFSRPRFFLRARARTHTHTHPEK